MLFVNVFEVMFGSDVTSEMAATITPEAKERYKSDVGLSPVTFAP